MAKSAPKRRLNRRAKRSIRRTMAAVMLITSIVVAAIPVPEAAAVDAGGGGTVTPTQPTPVSYPAAFDKFDIKHDMVASLDKTGKTENPAYTVTQLSDGQWQLEWQFKFFAENGQRGVISEYNSTYFSKEVTLNPNVKMAYEVVEKDTYNDFYENTVANLKYEITYQQYIDKLEPQAAKPFFDKYFPGAYEARAKIWDKYTEDLAKWEALIPEEQAKLPKPELKPGEETLSMGPQDLTKEQKLEFYCFYQDTYPGATLVEVIDYRKGVSYPNTLAYMPKGGNGETKDENGFWYDKNKMASIIAIGDLAFENITNVDILHLPSEIKYIGEAAFRNSFIQEVTFENVETIGHEAFKGCSQLKTATLNKGTTIIGNEAFYDTGITDIVFPWTIGRIGGGAFADCRNLRTVDFGGITQQNSQIDKYAFYNDTALNTVNFGSSTITALGEGAFAVTDGVSGSLDTFAFPAKIATAPDKLGDFMFAGRTNMKKVVMPADFGRAAKGDASKIPEHTFQGCINLEYVEFPADGNGSCGYASYDPALFANVINENFYVKGPELDREGAKAMPRQSTWKAKTQAAEYVPYVYMKNGVDYYEVSKDSYLLLIDGKGELNSCEAIRDMSPGFELVIPEQVGMIRVQSIAPGCFDEEPQIKENVGSIVIKDGSVTNIGNGVFSDCKLLTKVFVGNSVTSIGNEAFANCPKLTDITFNTPADGNYGAFTIGTDALTTGSDRLTVHADVADGYAPFTWAMNPNNYVDKTSGTRVCYEGLAPKYMTAIINNDTNEPTLVDYPRYNEIDTKNLDYIKELAKYYITKYGEQAQTDPTTIPACECCPDPREYHINQDYTQYIKDYSIKKKYENHVLKGVPTQFEWQTMTPKELEIINATEHIVVPSGITSIDAYEYFSDEKGSNASSISKYFSMSDKNYEMCQPGDPKKDIQPGIFSGDLNDEYSNEDAALYEKEVKGNDRVRSITLTAVNKLPDYAFDSCERLETVVLGEACEDIGTAPFRGCTNLTNVAGNQYYTSDNGIIYSKKADGTLHIEECLAARGSSGENSIGTQHITMETDPLLAQVSSIEVGAFQNCDNITRVDFSKMDKLTIIPKECFNGCDNLSEVLLPETTREIREDAFSDIKGIRVTIPAREVSIEDTAFDRRNGTIRTYKDSAAARYAEYHEISLEYFEDKYKVTFLDYDGTELDVQYVEEGGTAVAPDVPKRKGYTFTGWSEDFKNVKKDLLIIAQYKVNAGSGGNNNNNSGGNNSSGGSNNSSSDNSDSNKNGIYSVTVINGTGSGTYKKGDTVTITANGPATGQKFDKWVTTSLNVAMANVTSVSTTFTMPDNAVVVTATFKSDGTNSSTGTGTGNGTVSGNNTTTTQPGYNSGTTVQITKPGISNTGLASAVVNGSSDKFRVVISESAEATAAIEAALRGQYGDRFDALRYVAMDISLYDATGTAKITNTQGLSVDITIPIPDALISYGGNNKAISAANGTLEHLGTRFTVIGGVPCMSFTATHFSPYGVYTDTQNLTASMDMTPKTGDGIHPKWFLAIGLMCASVVLFTKKDEKRKIRTA